MLTECKITSNLKIIAVRFLKHSNQIWKTFSSQTWLGWLPQRSRRKYWFQKSQFLSGQKWVLKTEIAQSREKFLFRLFHDAIMISSWRNRFPKTTEKRFRINFETFHENKCDYFLKNRNVSYYATHKSHFWDFFFPLFFRFEWEQIWITVREKGRKNLRQLFESCLKSSSQKKKILRKVAETIFGWKSLCMDCFDALQIWLWGVGSYFLNVKTELSRLLYYDKQQQTTTTWKIAQTYFSLHFMDKYLTRRMLHCWKFRAIFLSSWCSFGS